MRIHARIDMAETESLALSAARGFQKTFTLQQYSAILLISCLVVESAVYDPTQPLLHIFPAFQVESMESCLLGGVYFERQTAQDLGGE